MCFCARHEGTSASGEASAEMLRPQKATATLHSREVDTRTWSHRDSRPSPLRRCVTPDPSGAVSVLSVWTFGQCYMMKGPPQPNHCRSLRQNRPSSSALSRMADSHHTISPIAKDLAHMDHHCSLPIRDHRWPVAPISHNNPNLNLRTRIPQRVQALIPSLARAPAQIVN